MTGEKKKKISKTGEELHFGKPGAVAYARLQAGGDWAAGILLYRVKHYFKPGTKKLNRFGKEWIAMSRNEWALEAGLTEGEMKNRALPKLRKRQFIDIRRMKLSPAGPVLLWISLDLVALNQWTEAEDMVWAILNNAGPGFEKPKSSYPYKKKVDVWDKLKTPVSAGGDTQ